MQLEAHAPSVPPSESISQPGLTEDPALTPSPRSPRSTTPSRTSASPSPTAPTTPRSSSRSRRRTWSTRSPSARPARSWPPVSPAPRSGASRGASGAVSSSSRAWSSPASGRVVARARTRSRHERHRNHRPPPHARSPEAGPDDLFPQRARRLRDLSLLPAAAPVARQNRTREMQLIPEALARAHMHDRQREADAERQAVRLVAAGACSAAPSASRCAPAARSPWPSCTENPRPPGRRRGAGPSGPAPRCVTRDRGRPAGLSSRG